MEDLDSLGALDFNLDRPAYTVSDLLREKKFPGGRTKFYDEVKRGEIALVRSGGQSIVMTPVLVNYYKRLMKISAAGRKAV
jgi:hypothetical protein